MIGGREIGKSNVAVSETSGHTGAAPLLHPVSQKIKKNTFQPFPSFLF
jgi:hypothetical protein